MRTTLNIDEKLLNKATQMSNSKTKTETVHKALRSLIDDERRKRLIGRLGKTNLNLMLKDLEKMQRDG